jgi:hypothetical protein
VVVKRWAGSDEVVKIFSCFSSGYTRGRSGRLNQEESSDREIDVTRSRDK